MQAFLKYALLFSFLGIATKLLLWSLGYLAETPEYGGMGYLLFLLLTSFLALYEKRKNQQGASEFLQDFKYGMKSIALYAVIVAGFTFIFYEVIDPDFFPNRIEERLALAEQTDMSTVQNPNIKNKEQLIEGERNIAELIYSSTFQTTITVFIFLLLGAVYTSIITFLVRKIT